MSVNRLRPPFLVAALLVAATPLRAADAVDGTVLAHDRVANVIVLTDKSVWSLATLEAGPPEDLMAGDRIEIRYESNEDDGVRVIHSVRRLP